MLVWRELNFESNKSQRSKLCIWMGSKKPNNKVVRILSKNWVEKQIKLTLVTSLSHQDPELELYWF